MSNCKCILGKECVHLLFLLLTPSVALVDVVTVIMVTPPEHQSLKHINAALIADTATLPINRLCCTIR